MDEKEEACSWFTGTPFHKWSLNYSLVIVEIKVNVNEESCVRVSLILRTYIVQKPIITTFFIYFSFGRYFRSSRLWQGGLQKLIYSLTASAKILFRLGAFLLTALSVTNYFVCTPKEISQDCQQHWSHFSPPDVLLVHLLPLALHNMKKKWRLWGDTAINLVNDFPFANETNDWVHNLHN